MTQAKIGSLSRASREVVLLYLGRKHKEDIHALRKLVRSFLGARPCVAGWG